MKHALVCGQDCEDKGGLSKRFAHTVLVGACFEVGLSILMPFQPVEVAVSCTCVDRMRMLCCMSAG